jgi:hypothetical protein
VYSAKNALQKAQDMQNKQAGGAGRSGGQVAGNRCGGRLMPGPFTGTFLIFTAGGNRPSPSNHLRNP